MAEDGSTASTATLCPASMTWIAEAFDEGRFADARHAGDTDSDRVARMRREAGQQFIGSITIDGTAGFNQRDRARQGAPVSIQHLSGQLLRIDLTHAWLRYAETGLFEFQDGLIDDQAFAFGCQHFDDPDIFNGAQAVFHFHGFDNGQFLAGLDLVSFSGGQSHQQSGHR